MARSASSFALFVLCTAGLAGCKQSFSLEEQRTVTLTNTLTKIIDAPSSEQRIRVHVLAADAPVHVYVFLEKDVNNDTDELVERGEKVPGQLASSIKTKEATLEVTIPAKQAYRVWITPFKHPTPVTLKINSI